MRANISFRTTVFRIGNSENKNACIKSNVAKIESIPTVMSIMKKTIAHRLLPGSMASIAGYATNGSSIPDIARSAMLIPIVCDTCPRKANSTVAASRDVQELMIGSQNELRMIFASYYRQLL